MDTNTRLSGAQAPESIVHVGPKAQTPLPASLSQSNVTTTKKAANGKSTGRGYTQKIKKSPRQSNPWPRSTKQPVALDCHFPSRYKTDRYTGQR